MLHHLLRFGLPSICAVCHSWPCAQPLCTACQQRFVPVQPRCAGCALPLPGAALAGPALRCGACLTQPPPLDACFAAVDYAYPWSGLLARFKFQSEPGLAALLGSLMLRSPGVAQAVGGADWLLPMPLSPQRLAQRGYNQALLLAQQLARQGAPQRCRADLLLRVQDTPPQTQQSRAARIANVRHAFAVQPLLASQLAGRSVLLVDDVMTSGASLYSAAAVLRQAGVARVGTVVLARTNSFAPAPETPG